MERFVRSRIRLRLLGLWRAAFWLSFGADEEGRLGGDAIRDFSLASLFAS